MMHGHMIVKLFVEQLLKCGILIFIQSCLIEGKLKCLFVYTLCEC